MFSLFRTKTTSTGVNFPNVLRAAFAHAMIPKEQKDTWWLSCLSAFLGSVHVKAARKHVGEIDHRRTRIARHALRGFFHFRTKVTECVIHGKRLKYLNRLNMICQKKNAHIVCQVSISSTFYAWLLCQYFCAKKLKSHERKAAESTFLQKKCSRKCWWNWLQVSISPTF